MLSEINGHTEILGILGDPLSHTLSPFLHNYLADASNRDLCYIPFHVSSEVPGDLEKAVVGAYALGIAGMNVTVPFKSCIIPFLKEIDPTAEKIGAVNTLVRTKDGYKGYNTDVLGMEKDLLVHGISLEKQSVVIIGAGGAARGAAWLSGFCHAKQLLIANRTKEKAESLAEEIGREFPDFRVFGVDLESVTEYMETGGEKYLAIQCTSVGLEPDVKANPVSEKKFYTMLSFAYDVIYRPEKTSFLREAMRAGVPCASGLGMLLRQGVSAYEMWTGEKISEKTVRELRDILRKAV